jgi:Lamin Tail Domain/Secretion system C-terminal sorting domain
MKNIFLAITLLLIWGTSYSQCSELFFSEYIEGSSSNKALEIYNPTDLTIDLSDYVVYRYNNGSLTPTDSLFPLGILNSKDVFVIGNPSANPSIQAASDTTHTMTFYNGDDALLLKNTFTGDTLDIIGEIGVDPGSGWIVGAGATNNFTLKRDSSIHEGNLNWVTAVNEWQVFPIDMVDSLGFHTMVPCAGPVECLTDLFFSEYIEGSSSNKALEIYNPKITNIDLSDYVVYRYNNGSFSPTDSLFPQGNLASKDVYVVGNPSANASIQAEADTTHTLTFYNGDDAVLLKNKATGDTLDIIGVIGVDPGSGWPVGAGATNNFTLKRDSSIHEGNTNWMAAVNEWEVFPIDMTDSLGFHNMIPCIPCSETYANVYDTACYTYTSPSGNYIWTNSGIYKDTILNHMLCDSIMDIFLVIDSIDTSLTISSPMITSNEIGATSFQWLDCGNAYSVIPGQTNQSFTALQGGSYAVEITKNNCVDTSACIVFVFTKQSEMSSESIIVYPNPSNGIINVDFNGIHNSSINVFNIQGILVYEKQKIKESVCQINLNIASGVYIMEIRNEEGVHLFKLLME